MNGIVHTAIHQVSQHEAGEKAGHIITHDKIHQQKNNGCDNKTGYRRHEQALFISGKFMVITVHDIGDAHNARIIADVMENIPVH